MVAIKVLLHSNLWIQTQINSPSEVCQGLPAFLVSHRAEKLCLSHKFFLFWKSCIWFSHFRSKYIMILCISCQISSVCWLTDDLDRFSRTFSCEKSVLNSPCSCFCLWIAAQFSWKHLVLRSVVLNVIHNPTIKIHASKILISRKGHWFIKGKNSGYPNSKKSSSVWNRGFLCTDILGSFLSLPYHSLTTNNSWCRIAEQAFSSNI